MRLLAACFLPVCILLLPACEENPSDARNPPGIHVEMVVLTGGSVRMGDIRGDGNRSDELPVHQVSLPPFMMSRYEITQELYLQITGSNPSGEIGNLQLPVENVTWLQAAAFCNQLSVLEGLTSCYTGLGESTVQCDFSANGYRLPTEAEWEYACRAGTESVYYVGDDAEALALAAWHAGNANGKTHAVGEKEANDFGLHDMHGNVAEWCWDWYDPAYYNTSSAQQPRGPGEGQAKVLRGGSCLSHVSELRSSFRGNVLPPGQKGRDTGIRLARSMK
jgi:formylglycine-generating enzyme required for sulfatase activity